VISYPQEPPSASRAPDGEPHAAERDAQRIEALLAPLQDALRQLWTLFQVHADRNRILRARERERTLQRLAGQGARLVLGLAGVLLVGIGLRGGLHALFVGRPWLAELVCGAVLLCAALAWGGVARRERVRAERRRLALRYARPSGPVEEPHT